MRFTFISTMVSSPWAGSEELWSRTAVQLKRAGHDVQASVVHRPRLSDKLALLAKQGIEIGTYPSYQATATRRIWDKVTLSYRRSYRRRPSQALTSANQLGAGRITQFL